MRGSSLSRAGREKMLVLAEQRINEGFELVLKNRAKILEEVRRAVLEGKQEGIRDLKAKLRERKQDIEGQLQELREEGQTPKDVTSQRVFSKGNEFSRRADKMLSEIAALESDSEIARMYAPR